MPVNALGLAGSLFVRSQRELERVRGTPAIVLQALGGWKDSRMVRTYTHLAAVDLLDHANAIRLPSALLSAGQNWARAAVSGKSQGGGDHYTITGGGQRGCTPPQKNGHRAMASEL